MERKVAYAWVNYDEMCYCGHKRGDHSGSTGRGLCGTCGCGCRHFTWRDRPVKEAREDAALVVPRDDGAQGGFLDPAEMQRSLE